MRSLVHVPLTFVLVYCALWYVDVATAEVKTTSGTATVDFVELHTKNLVKCREAANETLQQIKCYELAVIHMQSNFSHWSSLALLYLRADLGIQAHEVMNQSVHYWLKYLEPHLNASGKDLSTTQMRWVDVLRFHFDLGVDNKTWFREEAVEMGFLLAKKFEIEHLPSDAHSVYYEFLLQTGAGESQAMDFHRRTGNVLALALSGPQNDSSVVFRIAEAVQPAIDGLVEHVLNKGPGTFDPPLRRMCGIEFNNGDELLLRDLVRHIDECVARWGNMTETLQLESDGPKDAPALNQWSGSMRETAMHRLAVAGATGTLRAIFESYPDARDVKIRADRFGRTLTHMAAAWGHESTLQLLLERGGDINTQDAGGLSPRHLGCDSPGFQETFIKLNRDKTVCEGYTRDKIIDDDADVTDDSGTDGGWNPRFKRPKYLHCDFDVRDAARITQSDLLAAYTHSNQPVVLRNSFYETDGPDFRWSKKKFNRTYGHMLIRQEYFARQSRWGLGGIVNVSNVTEWLDTLDENDGKIATVNVDLVNHPLAEIADSWVPPSLVNKKRTDEIEFFDAKVTVPTVHLNKRGSKSNHYIRAQSMFHTVVYGHQEWVLLPPRDARTLRDVLPEKLAPLAKRCELMTGDVLIIPDLWSASWVSKNNGVSMERYFYKKARSG